MICQLTFNEEMGCIKPVTSYEVNIYALGTVGNIIGGSPANTLLASFYTENLNVNFILVNETSEDIASAFSGVFKNSVTVDTEILTEDILLCYRVTSGCGVSDWCCVRVISDNLEPMAFIAFDTFFSGDVT